jgi:hypothetical protein
MKEIDENGKEFTRLANGKPFRGIDLQLQLGLINKEKHAYHLARGTYGCVTPAPHPIIEAWFPHRWWE